MRCLGLEHSINASLTTAWYCTIVRQCTCCLLQLKDYKTRIYHFKRDDLEFDHCLKSMTSPRTVTVCCYLSVANQEMIQERHEVDVHIRLLQNMQVESMSPA